MDTFFATKKGGQSSIGHICRQFFSLTKDLYICGTHEEKIRNPS